MDNVQGWQRLISFAIIAGLVGFALWHGTPLEALTVILAGLVNSPLAGVLGPKQPDGTK